MWVKIRESWVRCQTGESHRQKGRMRCWCNREKETKITAQWKDEKNKRRQAGIEVSERVMSVARQNETLALSLPFYLQPAKHQRCSCPTHQDAREFHKSVHVKVGGLENIKEVEPGEQWKQFLWSRPPAMAAESTAPENLVAAERWRTWLQPSRHSSTHSHR